MVEEVNKMNRCYEHEVIKELPYQPLKLDPDLEARKIWGFPVKWQTNESRSNSCKKKTMKVPNKA